MIGTFVSSPLGLGIGVVLLVLVGAWCYAQRVIRVTVAELAELAERRRARRPVARRPTLAGILFAEAGMPGRIDCPECHGDGGRVVMTPIPWGFGVELEAQLGIYLPERAHLPIPVRCELCDTAEREQLAALVAGAPCGLPAMAAEPGLDPADVYPVDPKVAG